MNSKPTLIVTGGGTGGHVAAGLAIAESWKEKFGGDAKVVFVGAQGGIEEIMVPRVGLPLQLLKLGSLKGVGLKKKILTLIKIPLALIQSFIILLNERPSAVVGVGGYASGPMVLVARFVSAFLNVKTAILEQNAVPGLTNRILSRFAHRVLSAFPGVESQFPEGKVTVTGNPVRKNIQPLPQAQRRPFTIFIFGGSQGARGINSLVLDALPHLKKYQTELKWIHQTGQADYERVKEGYEKNGITAEVQKFFHNMPELYQSASLLICRSGSSTLSEIAAIGRASFLIPFPFASDNHQEKNARIFENAGAAVTLLQDETQGEQLAKRIVELIENPQAITKMEEAVKSFYRPRAASDIVEKLI